MEPWERWSLRKAAFWGAGFACVSLLIGFFVEPGITISRLAWSLIGLAETAAVFALIAALRNWIFRESISPKRKVPRDL
jgi:hypothetical protein